MRGDCPFDERLDDVHDLLLLTPRQRGDSIEDLAGSTRRPALASGLDPQQLVGRGIQSRRKRDDLLGLEGDRPPFPVCDQSLIYTHASRELRLRQPRLCPRFCQSFAERRPLASCGSARFHDVRINGLAESYRNLLHDLCKIRISRVQVKIVRFRS